MSGKKIKKVDVPTCVRTDELLCTKLHVVADIDNRPLSHQFRDSLSKGVDLRLAELGKDAMDRVCREMSATSEAAPAIPAVSAGVGPRRAPYVNVRTNQRKAVAS
jgi:hypothetical protein